MNPDEAVEFAKKISDARTDIEKLNKAIVDHPYGHKQHEIFYKISSNADYSSFIKTLKEARNLYGSLPFESLKYNMQRTVLIMLRDAVQLFIDAKTVNEVVKEITDDKNNK